MLVTYKVAVKTLPPLCHGLAQGQLVENMAEPMTPALFCLLKTILCFI